MQLSQDIPSGWESSDLKNPEVPRKGLKPSSELSLSESLNKTTIFKELQSNGLQLGHQFSSVKNLSICKGSSSTRVSEAWATSKHELLQSTLPLLCHLSDHPSRTHLHLNVPALPKTQYLVLIIYQQQDLGIVLIHDREKQGLQDGALEHWGSHLTPLPKNGIEDIQGTHPCFLRWVGKHGKNTHHKGKPGNLTLQLSWEGFPTLCQLCGSWPQGNSPLG